MKLAMKVKIGEDQPQFINQKHQGRLRYVLTNPQACASFTKFF
jgi:hypothetical protein